MSNSVRSTYKPRFENMPKEGGSKPTEAGIQYGYSLVDVKYLDTRIEFRLEKASTNNYMTYSVWTKPFNMPTTDEDKIKFQNQLMDIMDGIMFIFMTPEVVKTVDGTTINSYMEKAVAMLNAYKGTAKVNFGLRYDKSGKYTEVSDKGLEKYTAEGVSAITFSDWEQKNRMTKNTTPVSGSGNGKGAGLSKDDLPF